MNETEQAGRPRRILLVDDDSMVRSAIEEFLGDLGHEVVIAENGKRAIDLFNEMRASIRLLITDICMPVLDGISLIRHVRQSDGDLPIAVITGYAGDMVFESIGHRRTTIFKKPVDFTELELFLELV